MLQNRLIRISIFVVSLFLIFSLSRSIVTLWQKGSIVTEEEDRLTDLQRQHEELQQKLDQLNDPTFVEKQARDKLGLGREGDYVVILPPVTPSLTATPTPVLENWQKWQKLFGFKVE